FAPPRYVKRLTYKILNDQVLCETSCARKLYPRALYRRQRSRAAITDGSSCDTISRMRSYLAASGGHCSSRFISHAAEGNDDGSTPLFESQMGVCSARGSSACTWGMKAVASKPHSSVSNRSSKSASEQ